MAGRSAVVERVVLAAAHMVMAGAAMVGGGMVAEEVDVGRSAVVELAAADMVMAGVAMVGGGVEWASRAEVGASTLLGRR